MLLPGNLTAAIQVDSMRAVPGLSLHATVTLEGLPESGFFDITFSDETSATIPKIVSVSVRLPVDRPQLREFLG